MKSRKLSFVNIIAAYIHPSQIIKLLPILLILALAMTACSSEGGASGGVSGGNGTVKINFSRSSGSRSASWVLNENVQNLAHKVIFSDSGRTISFEVGQGVTSYTATVPAGNWDLTIKAYYMLTSFLVAKGDTTVSIKAGQNNPVSVAMSKAYYERGNIGPGGGIIFMAADPGSSDFKGLINTATGEMCYYLEVANVDLGPYTWASPAYDNTFIQDTGTSTSEVPSGGSGGGIEQYFTNIAGMQNTNLILAKDPTAPAAKACRDYRGGGKADWFLPSHGELLLLCQLWSQRGADASPLTGFTDLSEYYWSSTQDSSDTAWYGYFDPSGGPTGGPGMNKGSKVSPYKVRPMRAFAE